VREIPVPTYDYEVQKLVSVYKRAVSDIQRELERLELTDISRANAQAALTEVARILASLDEESSAWVGEHIPQAARDGIVRSLIGLGIVETVEEAESIAKFNRINKAMVDAAISDTQTDVLAITQNITKRVRTAVRAATAEAMRANMAKGVNGRRTISRDIVSGIRKSLGSAADGAIRDAAGRVWRVEKYVDMLARTKMLNTHIEATTNEAIQRGVYTFVVSSHGAKDGCGRWEGKILKLSSEYPGDYPTIDEAKANNGLFHPGCRHVITPRRLKDT